MSSDAVNATNAGLLLPFHFIHLLNSFLHFLIILVRFWRHLGSSWLDLRNAAALPPQFLNQILPFLALFGRISGLSKSCQDYSAALSPLPWLKRPHCPALRMTGLAGSRSRHIPPPLRRDKAKSGSSHDPMKIDEMDSYFAYIQ